MLRVTSYGMYITLGSNGMMIDKMEKITFHIGLLGIKL